MENKMETILNDILKSVPKKLEHLLINSNEPLQGEIDDITYDLLGNDGKAKNIFVDGIGTLTFYGQNSDATIQEFVTFADVTLELVIKFENAIYTKFIDEDVLNQIGKSEDSVNGQTKNDGIFFRHIRPFEFNPKTFSLDKKYNGGITVMFKPIKEQHSMYDYWLYVCPLDVPFSAKQATHKLKQLDDVVPFGTVSISGALTPVNAVLQDIEHGEKPYAVRTPSEIFKSILANNEIEINKFKEFKESCKDVDQLYRNIPGEAA